MEIKTSGGYSLKIKINNSNNKAPGPWGYKKNKVMRYKITANEVEELNYITREDFNVFLEDFRNHKKEIVDLIDKALKTK